jgi:hypothetical protein
MKERKCFDIKLYKLTIVILRGVAQECSSLLHRFFQSQASQKGRKNTGHILEYLEQHRDKDKGCRDCLWVRLQRRGKGNISARTD